MRPAWQSLLLCVALPVFGLGAQAAGGELRVDSISLLPVANRALRDDVAGDGRGGWTDQGPDNDLASFRPGRFTISGVTFDVPDGVPGGRVALVLGRANQHVAPEAGEASRGEAGSETRPEDLLHATVPMPAPDRAYRFLYLLHATAGLPAGAHPVGSLVARYGDGTTTRHTVLNRRDIGNWRDPAPAVNAGVAWESENPTATIGLYVSRFAVDEKALASVTFELAGAAPWMILGLSGSHAELAVGTVPRRLVIEPGPDWAAYAHSLDVAPGGVFDFSSLLQPPAGRFGALRVSAEGRFEFTERPGERVRLWGVNLCFTAQFLERPEADLLAERLARSGYNTVRFHHFDADLVRGGKFSWELNPEALDRLEYLFAALKRRGIYINLDLYSSRPFSPEEYNRWGLPAGQGRNAFKQVLPVSEAAFDSWARFATHLLTHRNPHTGLTWAEDPALIGICPVNENPLFNRIERPPEVLALYREAFAGAGGQGEANGTNPEFNRFIHETNRRSDARMAAHLRSLGTKALLTGANYTIAQGLAYVRQDYDYVDCHSYWDHPKFPEKAWALPIQFGQGSAVRARAKMPNRIMPTRVFGRPFVSTEFNFCRPNQHRFEGAVLMPAYASLQDWDAMYNFQYAMSRPMAVHSGVENYFAIANDPIGLIADRVGALIFQRGDIAPAGRAIAYAVQPEEAFSSLGRLFPGEFSPLGLVARIGSLTGTPAEVARRIDPAVGLAGIVSGRIPAGSPPNAFAMRPDLAGTLQRAGVLPPESVSADHTRYRSDTGQIELRADTGAVTVASPRSEHFLLPAGATLRGAFTSVANGGTRGAVAVISLPVGDAGAAPLVEARRLLVTHLTDALPAGMTFAHLDRKRLEAWGRGPHLVARGEATLTLRLPPGDWQAWAVDATGTRRQEVPLVRRNGEHVLELRTITPAGTQLAYELARR